MMTRLLAAAAVAVAALAVPATADHVTAECRFLSVSDAELTGGAWEGVMYGTVTAPGEDAVTVRCEIRVNGAAVTGTPTGGPTPSVAVTAGEIRYESTLSDEVEACAVHTTGHGTGTSCRPATSTTIPPCQALGSCDVVTIALETLRDVEVEEIDPRVCPMLAAHRPGAPPYVGTDAEGDVYVLGALWWDCPPYRPGS